MKKVLVLAMIILLMACTSNKIIDKEEIKETTPSKLPKVNAFEDEYTRQFMYSTEEIEQGYYLFESLTEKYTMMFPEDGFILDDLRDKDDTHEHMEFMFPLSEDIQLPYYKLNFSYSTIDTDEKAVEKMRVYPDVEEDYRNNMEIIETEDKLIHHVWIEREQYEEVSYHLTGLIESKEVAQMIYYDAKIMINETESPLPDALLKDISEEIFQQLESVQFAKG